MKKLKLFLVLLTLITLSNFFVVNASTDPWGDALGSKDGKATFLCKYSYIDSDDYNIYISIYEYDGKYYLNRSNPNVMYGWYYENEYDISDINSFVCPAFVYSDGQNYSDSSKSDLTIYQNYDDVAKDFAESVGITNYKNDIENDLEITLSDLMDARYAGFYDGYGDVEQMCFYEYIDLDSNYDIAIGVYKDYEGQISVTSYTYNGYYEDWYWISNIYVDTYVNDFAVYGNADFETGICPTNGYAFGYTFCFDSDGYACTNKFSDLDVYTDDYSSGEGGYLYDDAELTEFVLCETSVLNIFRFIGYILLLVKILVPIIIIVLSMIEFFRAITAGEEKDMQGSLVSLAKKLIAGVIIFIIPTILNFLILLIEDIGETKSDFYNCHICLLNPLSDVCESEVEKTN